MASLIAVGPWHIVHLLSASVAPRPADSPEPARIMPRSSTTCVDTGPDLSSPCCTQLEGTPAARRFVRSALVPSNALMRSLGRPNREQVVTTRPDLLTTLQALDLSNGQFLADTLAQGAARMLKEHPKATPDERIRELYRQALCRPPTESELAVARELLGSPVKAEGLADLLWALLMLPELQLIR